MVKQIIKEETETINDLEVFNNNEKKFEEMANNLIIDSVPIDFIGSNRFPLNYSWRDYLDRNEGFKTNPYKESIKYPIQEGFGYDQILGVGLITLKRLKIEITEEVIQKLKQYIKSMTHDGYDSFKLFSN